MARFVLIENAQGTTEAINVDQVTRIFPEDHNPSLSIVEFAFFKVDASGGLVHTVIVKGDVAAVMRKFE